MTIDQMAVFAIIAIAMAMFVWGRVRYDIIAVMALLAGVFANVIPSRAAFDGFSHPAVITVAAVLIISRCLQNSGLVDYLVRMLAPSRRTTRLQVAATTSLGALLSCFMNNVGALALMLPVTLRNAIKARRSPSLVLMPLSFATLLGGMVTLIGTPPNIVISGFREDVTGTPFQMFDFAPVGLMVCLGGVLYLTFIGWQFLVERVPAKSNAGFAGVESYTFEAGLPDDSPLIGTRVRELEEMCENEVTVMAIIRTGIKRLAPDASERFRAGDMLIIEGDPALVDPLADGKRLTKLGQVHTDTAGSGLKSDDVRIVEAVVKPNSALEGRSMRAVMLHARHGLNLLAMSRAGKTPVVRLKNIRFRAGDVLLLQGDAQRIETAMEVLGCMVLANRGLQPLRGGTRALLPAGIFAVAIGLSAMGLVTVPIAFVTACVVMIMAGLISISEIYEGVEWPVLVLLAAMIPVGQALEATGGTALVSGFLLQAGEGVPVWVMLGLLVAGSMWMSDIVPNATTAILMAPVAIQVAAGLNMGADAFLMAVAVGASAPFLTPIGHQSNTLVMGPGGYRFTDYARMGFIMELLVVLISVPSIMMFWQM